MPLFAALRSLLGLLNFVWKNSSSSGLCRPIPTGLIFCGIQKLARYVFINVFHRKGIISCSRLNWSISEPQGLTQKNSWTNGFLSFNRQRLVIVKHALSGAWSWGILQAKKIRSACNLHRIRGLFRTELHCRSCLTLMLILCLFLPRHSNLKLHNHFPSGKGRNGQISPTKFVHRYLWCWAIVWLRHLEKLIVWIGMF